MAAWFGHTQTLTSISKSVSTVASGIMGLEANLATFMQKVTYYDKFFQRVGPNLPAEVIKTASLLFARCYEYRDEIRDELESSLAYVADAGRWVIGMEDWNSKMEKRLGQISELVLLSNTLLVEYALTGHWGAQGEKDGLDAYLRTLANSVVLHNAQGPAKPTSMLKKREETSDDAYEHSLFPPAKQEMAVEATAEDPNVPRPCVVNGDNSNLLSPTAAVTSADSTPPMSDNDGELFLARSSGDSTDLGGEFAAAKSDAAALPAPTAPKSGADEDDDVLNPFARSYQPPVSVESSLGSLRAESDTGSVYFNAMDSQHMGVLSGGGGENEYEPGDEPDSPVSLGEYECLDMESIPQYVAFKPSAMSRKRRLKQQYNQFFGGQNTSLSASVESIRSTQSMPVAPPSSQSSPIRSPRLTSATKIVAGQLKDRQRLMDLTYSYDFQREVTFNPFASPGMNSTTLTANPLPPPLELSLRQIVPTVEEEEPIQEIKEQSFGHERQSDDALPAPVPGAIKLPISSEPVNNAELARNGCSTDVAQGLASEGGGSELSSSLDSDELSAMFSATDDSSDDLLRFLQADEHIPTSQGELT